MSLNIVQQRKLRFSKKEIHYHQSPILKWPSIQDIYPPAFEPEPENTAETFKLGSGAGGTEVEYLNSADNTDIGAVGGSDPTL